MAVLMMIPYLEEARCYLELLNDKGIQVRTCKTHAFLDILILVPIIMYLSKVWS